MVWIEASNERHEQSYFTAGKRNEVNSGFTLITAEELPAKVRLNLSEVFIESVAKVHEMEKLLVESRSWSGFPHAFESWHTARWEAVDQVTPPELAAKLVTAIQIEEIQWSESPFLPAQRPFILETIRQEYLQHRALFLRAMAGVEATDLNTYRLFSNRMRMAEKVGDETFLRELARQKQRKPTKDKGDRSLYDLLLLQWIAGCLWAFSTDGIGAFLQDLYPRKKPYNAKTISDAWRDLKLHRLQRPLYWGVAGRPPRLIPL
jgi:hypothetical protein